MNITVMLTRVDNAYTHLGQVHASGAELDHLAMARQELRNLYKELTQAQNEERKVEADG